MNTSALTPKLPVALLVLCVVIAFYPAIHAGYIWDDDALLVSNPQMHSEHGLAEIWQGKNSRDYTPLTLSVFWLESRLWSDAAPYHIVNLLLHAAAAVLLWRVLAALRIPGAWLGALLFAIHPVSVASAAWVAELKNTLSALFYFASILAFIRATSRDDPPSSTAPVAAVPSRCRACFYITSIILFLLAGLGKGAVVTLPAILFGCILWQKKADEKLTFRHLLQLVPFALIALVIAWLTIHYQSRAVHYDLIPDTIPYRIARAGIAFWWYLQSIFFPIGLSPIAPQWRIDTASPFAYLPALAAFTAILLPVWFFARRARSRAWSRPILFAWGYYLCTLLPILGFVWMTLQQETPATDWWQYTAAPVIFALIAAAFANALQHVTKNTRPVLWAAFSVVVLLLFIQSWRRTAIYKNMETYCRAVTTEVPGAWTLQNNLGVVLKQRGLPLEAIPHYRQSLAANPKFVEARSNLANALAASGNFPEAEVEYHTALSQRPDNPDLLFSLSLIAYHQGKLREAIATQAAALKADRLNPLRYDQFGLLLMENKQFDQAIIVFKNGILLAPENVDIQINLARTLLAAGRKEEFFAVCKTAMALAQKSGDGMRISEINMLLDEEKHPIE